MYGAHCTPVTCPAVNCNISMKDIFLSDNEMDWWRNLMLSTSRIVKFPGRSSSVAIADALGVNPLQLRFPVQPDVMSRVLDVSLASSQAYDKMVATYGIDGIKDVARDSIPYISIADLAYEYSDGFYGYSHTGNTVIVEVMAFDMPVAYNGSIVIANMDEIIAAVFDRDIDNNLTCDLYRPRISDSLLNQWRTTTWGKDCPTDGHLVCRAVNNPTWNRSADCDDFSLVDLLGLDLCQRTDRHRAMTRRWTTPQHYQ